MPRSTLLVAGLVAGLGLTVLGGCKSNSMSQISWTEEGVPHFEHPTQDWWHHQWVYFPDAQVYHEPHSNMWFWFSDGVWHDGSEPPADRQLSPDRATVVKTFADRPHFSHHANAAQCGPWYAVYPSSVDQSFDTQMANHPDAFFH